MSSLFWLVGYFFFKQLWHLHKGTFWCLMRCNHTVIFLHWNSQSFYSCLFLQRLLTNTHLGLCLSWIQLKPDNRVKRYTDTLWLHKLVSPRSQLKKKPHLIKWAYFQLKITTEKLVSAYSNLFLILCFKMLVWRFLFHLGSMWPKMLIYKLLTKLRWWTACGE